jgi:hypothetical protein
VDFYKLNDVLDRSVPDVNARDMVVVLVNDPEYGGAGGAYAVASMHPAASEILLHEAGHSFALLADEYFGSAPPSCALFEPSAPNVTMETRREAIKWQAWIDAATPLPTAGPTSAWPGLYQGARYCSDGMFRPTYNSKMRTLGVPFEQINVEAHVKRTYNRVSPIDAVSPPPGALQVHQGQEISFQVSAPSPMTHALEVAWTVDGVRLGAAQVFRFVASAFSPGSHTLVVTVSDPTPLVRHDPGGLLRDSRAWTVEVVGSAGGPFGGAPREVPGTIQAEDFDEGGRGVAYHDTSAGNAGGVYRNTDVDLQATSDTGGGYNVGWMKAGEWLRYTIAVPTSGTYSLTARVAARAAGGTFHVAVDGVNRTGPLVIPDTGDWQVWRDVTATVTLSAGVQEMRFVADANGPTGVFGNLNFIRLTAAGTGSTPFGGAPREVPGTIQAEDFDEGGKGVAYHDTSAGNAGSAYRNTDVDLQATSDAGGGYNVGWLTAGEWLRYTIAVSESQSYTLTARVAASGAGGTFHVEVDGVDETGPLTIPDTGGWQTWRDVTATVTLTAGVRVIRFVADSKGPTGVFGNLNFLRLTAAAAGPAPFGGTPREVPGTIQAEDFDEGGRGVAYHDTSAGNAGGAYRNTDVDLQATSDAGGGYNIGWMTAGEWLRYTIAVPSSGTYSLTARVAAHGAGGTFHVEVDGVDRTGPLVIPDTGGWQVWRDVTATVTLNAGVRKMRFVADANGPTGVFGNLNFVRIARVH